MCLRNFIIYKFYNQTKLFSSGMLYIPPNCHDSIQNITKKHDHHVNVSMPTCLDCLDDKYNPT